MSETNEFSCRDPDFGKFGKEERFFPFCIVIGEMQTFKKYVASFLHPLPNEIMIDKFYGRIWCVISR